MEVKNSMREQIMSGIFECPPTASPFLKDLITKMLVVIHLPPAKGDTPKKRLKIDEILNHPWFNDMPPIETLEIFNDTEITIMKQKFIFVDPEENGN